MEKVGLVGVKDTPANALSHGDQRLLEVGVALAVNPTLLFLDEPTAGMNPVERVKILENIRQLSRGGQTTFVLVEHDMDIVFSLSERVVVLHRGEILGDGTPDEIKNNARSGKCIWGIRFERHNGMTQSPRNSKHEISRNIMTPNSLKTF